MGKISFNNRIGLNCGQPEEFRKPPKLLLFWQINLKGSNPWDVQDFSLNKSLEACG